MTREDYLIRIMSYMNIPYIWGSKNPVNGLDCSGFAERVLGELFLDPPGVQNAQHLNDYFVHEGHGRQMGKDETPDLGDLVFYGHQDGSIHHVAVCLNGTQIAEAGGGGPDCTSRAVAESKGAKVRVSLRNHRGDQIRLVRPAGLPWNPLV